MKTSQVIAYLDEVMHPEYQEDYDNSGFLAGDSRSDYKGALVALDMTEAVLDEALAEGLNLIVTHHPFIFRGMKRMTDRTADGRLLMRLIESGVCLYAAHTNLDNMPWGVNGALAERLGLCNTKVLRAQGLENDACASPFATPHSPLATQIGAGLVGELPQPEAAEAFLLRVKTLLGLPMVRTSPLPATQQSLPTIKKVAICGGSGSDFIGDALAARADIYLTGDLKYHDFQRTDGRMLLADIGHYESEQFAREVIARTIGERFADRPCRISARQQGIVNYL